MMEEHKLTHLQANEVHEIVSALMSVAPEISIAVRNQQSFWKTELETRFVGTAVWAEMLQGLSLLDLQGSEWYEAYRVLLKDVVVDKCWLQSMAWNIPSQVMRMGDISQGRRTNGTVLDHRPSGRSSDFVEVGGMSQGKLIFVNKCPLRLRAMDLSGGVAESVPLRLLSLARRKGRTYFLALDNRHALVLTQTRDNESLLTCLTLHDTSSPTLAASQSFFLPSEMLDLSIVQCVMDSRVVVALVRKEGGPRGAGAGLCSWDRRTGQHLSFMELEFRFRLEDEVVMTMCKGAVRVWFHGNLTNETMEESDEREEDESRREQAEVLHMQQQQQQRPQPRRRRRCKHPQPRAGDEEVQDDDEEVHDDVLRMWDDDDDERRKDILRMWEVRPADMYVLRRNVKTYYFIGKPWAFCAGGRYCVTERENSVPCVYEDRSYDNNPNSSIRYQYLHVDANGVGRKLGEVAGVRGMVAFEMTSLHRHRATTHCVLLLMDVGSRAPEPDNSKIPHRGGVNGDGSIVDVGMGNLRHGGILWGSDEEERRECPVGMFVADGLLVVTFSAVPSTHPHPGNTDAWGRYKDEDDPVSGAVIVVRVWDLTTICVDKVRAIIRSSSSSSSSAASSSSSVAVPAATPPSSSSSFKPK